MKGYRILLLICSFVISAIGYAQETQLVKPVEDKTASAGAEESKVIVLSNSDNLHMSHSIGDELGVKRELSAGVFEYSFVYKFPEDYDDDFMKTQLTLRMDAGQETVPLVMYKGKVYKGSYYEILKLNVKKDNDAVYPYEKAAKLTFTSPLDELTILCNGRTLFKEGKNCEQKGSNINKVTVAERDGQHEYSIFFTLDDAQSFDVNFKNNLNFDILSAGFSKTSVSLPSLHSRASYNFMVVGNVKIIEKEVTYEDLLSVAEEYSKNFLSQNKSVYFSAAAEAYEEVRKHKDCPLNLIDTYQNKANAFKVIRNCTNMIEQAQAKWKEYEEKEGFSSLRVWKYISYGLRKCDELLALHPEMTYYKSVRESFDEAYQRHPKSSVKYPVIQGKVTKGEGWFLPIEGVRIYGVYTKADRVKDVKNEEPIGFVHNGYYKVVLKEKFGYLYFAGEKDSHWIEYKDQILDIELTR